MSESYFRNIFGTVWTVKLCFLLLIVYSLMNCNKRTEKPQCPVEYETKPTKFQKLTGTWRFVSFESPEEKLTEYPPCGNNEVFIIFTDSLHTRTGEEFVYPYLFHGKVSINSYIGSYQKESGKIHFSETIKSLVGGTDDLEDFQEKYHEAMRSAESYNIVNNLLMIYYESGKKQMLFVSNN